MPREYVIGYMNVNFLIANQETAPLVVGRLADHVTARGQGLALHLSNAYTLTCARSSDAVREALTKDLSFPDGVPLAKLARRRASEIGQVYGPQLMRDALAQTTTSGLRHFLYGGSEETNDALAAHIAETYPDANIVGRMSPPFRAATPADRDAAVAALAQCQAQVIWVGLGTPRQDIECYELRRMYPGVFIAVGAAFDFLPGVKRDCPEWIRKMGLQWLHRLLSEPKRLWRRYLVGNTVFIGLALLHGWRRPKRQSLEDWLAEQS